MAKAEPAPPTAWERAEVDRANASGQRPVVFVHGLWLLASSWDPWREMFEAAGYTTLAPGWPDDPATVEEGRPHPELFAGKSVGAISDHYATVIGELKIKPIIIGHSFGGLITQRLAGQGLGVASVPIDPGPFRVCSRCRSRPSKPHRRSSATQPTGAARSCSPPSSSGSRSPTPSAKPRRTTSTQSSPSPGPESRSFKPRSPTSTPAPRRRSTRRTPKRGPMLVISGEKDHTVPWAIANASFKKQRRNKANTEIIEMPGRGHSLVIDSGWTEVAQTALAFVKANSA